MIGVDNSAPMLEQAKAAALPGRLDFVQADLSTWAPDSPIDLLVSNAALQWVPDHEQSFSRLPGMLSAGGTLAVQMPYHFQHPAHQIIEATKTDRAGAPCCAGSVSIKSR